MLISCVAKVTAAAALPCESTLRTSSSLVNALSVLSLTDIKPKSNPLLATDVSVRFRYIPKKTLSKRFPGHIELYDEKEGKRESLYAAVERYKRLDWGMYVGTNIGRYTKRWKKTGDLNWRNEQHKFMDQYSNLLLERMFNHEVKLPRYLPDDPWQKYNDLPHWRHRAALNKNRKLIEKYGNRDHLYGRYHTHDIGIYGKPNTMPKHLYMPPDYLRAVAENPARTYRPDPETAPPSNEPAPFFQRKKLNRTRRLGLDRIKEMRKMRRSEAFLDEPLPLWNEAFNPTVNQR